MTYIVIVWNNQKERKVLKGFDKKVPVFVTETQWKNGKPIQEFETIEKASIAIDKIDKHERWRNRAIVELH